MSFFRAGPPLRIKICGITNETDARMAIDAGADAIGFNFFRESARCLDFAANRAWIEGLAGAAERVAVVVNPSAEDVAALRDSGCFEAIQFHGDESPAFCAAAGFERWIRAVRVKDVASIEEIREYETPYILLDSWSRAAYGGTGRRLNWDLAREAILAYPERRILLAGGLTPHNVRDAVRIARPHAVDVASGVELDPRHKNEYLLREFIQVARAA